MKICVKLIDLLDGSFRFYIDELFRKNIFSKLYSKYKDWRYVATALNIDARSLYGIRRGYEVPKGNKHYRYFSGKHIKYVVSALDFDLKEIERNITHIKLGQSGLRFDVALPVIVDLEAEPIDTVNRALAEYIFAKQQTFDFDLGIFNNFTHKNDYVSLNVELSLDKLKLLRNQGLKPELSTQEKHYVLTYRVPGTNVRVTRFVPKQVIFDEIFAKEFGKWIGDRCGGWNKVGVTNKQFSFVKSFYDFLVILEQPINQVNLYATCKYGFEPNHDILSKVKTVTVCKTQYGDYAYRTEISNKFLRNLVFDVFENNLYDILLASKASVKHAFYAGLVEAEGSIDLRSGELFIAFGYNLLKKHSSKEFLDLLRVVQSHIKILESFGYEPCVSRKVCKSSIKYDLRFKREDTLRFIDNTVCFINHEQKLESMSKLKGKTTVTKLPEINIGLIGHR